MNKKIKQNSNFLSWCEIDTKAIQYNLRQIKKIAKTNKFFLSSRQQIAAKINTEILPVIKANAYGHGVEAVVQALKEEGIHFLAVSDVKEGVELRKLGIEEPILLLENTLNQFVDEIVEHNLMPMVCEYGFAEMLNSKAEELNQIIDVHVKVDTGMGRLGVWHEEAFELVCQLHELKNIRLLGIFTHFPAADTNRKHTLKQIHYLYDLVTRLDKKGIVIPFIHGANSVGFAGYKTHILNLARPGLLIYGLYSHESIRKKISLKPVMSVLSRIIFVKDVQKGSSISYGRTFIAKKNMKIATIPIGYNDGYMRSISNKGYVLIKGKRCAILGRVTMDQIMVDVTGIARVKANDIAVIIGKQGQQTITADEVAKWAGTINYEVVCSLGNRLEHVIR